MEFETPDSLCYTDDDLWLSASGDIRRLGVTDYAQDQLGDVVYLELPAPGSRLDLGQAFGVIESAKAVIDLVSPASGRVIARNEAAIERPELVNESPYELAWLLEIEVSKVAEGLLSAGEYAELRRDDEG